MQFQREIGFKLLYPHLYVMMLALNDKKYMFVITTIPDIIKYGDINGESVKGVTRLTL